MPPALETALHDESVVVRAQAVRGIADVNVPPDRVMAIVTVLTEAIKDRDWWIRGYAASSLASLGPQGIAALERITAGDDTFAAHRATEQLALHRRELPVTAPVESS